MEYFLSIPKNNFPFNFQTMAASRIDHPYVCPFVHLLTDGIYACLFGNPRRITYNLASLCSMVLKLQALIKFVKSPRRNLQCPIRYFYDIWKLDHCRIMTVSKNLENRLYKVYITDTASKKSVRNILCHLQHYQCHKLPQES